MPKVALKCTEIGWNTGVKTFLEIKLTLRHEGAGIKQD